LQVLSTPAGRGAGQHLDIKVEGVPMDAEAAQAYNVVAALPDDSKKSVTAALASADPNWIPAGDAGRTKIWMTLLIVLGAITLASIGATVWLYTKDKDGTAVIAVATLIVGGVFGLLSKAQGST
jgi:hypothetical protein